MDRIEELRALVEEAALPWVENMADGVLDARGYLIVDNVGPREVLVAAVNSLPLLLDVLEAARVVVGYFENRDAPNGIINGLRFAVEAFEGSGK